MKNVNVNTCSDGISAGNIVTHVDEEIKRVDVKHDTSNGKNEVEVKVDGKVVFRYDSNRKGCYMKNNIQTPFENYVGELNIGTITEACITTETISESSITKD